MSTLTEYELKKKIANEMMDAARAKRETARKLEDQLHHVVLAMVEAGHALEDIAAALHQTAQRASEAHTAVWIQTP